MPAVLTNLLKTLAGREGLELDPEELESIGLSDDEEEAAPPAAAADDVLSKDLEGSAAGRIELFLSTKSTNIEPIKGSDGLMWEPIIRSGQWAVRPGTTGKTKRIPLKVVAGHSKNQRREIGLADIVAAHEDEAVQHVTVPLSHANSTAENQGFVDKLKIVDGTVKDQKTKQMVDCKVLMGGYRITEPEAKGKLERGTWANRSAGILYDYVNTETGKSYPVVLEHVAITNKPWITGMASFGRKLAGTGEKLDTVALDLSDEGPDEDEYALSLSAEGQLGDSEGDFLAQEADDWSKENSPTWLAQQVNSVLREARAKKLEAKRASVAVADGSPAYFDYEYPPNYRCAEARPGKALISDGYGDDSNFWAAPITVKNGALEVGEFSTWSSLKKAFIPDDRPAPTGDKLPLEREQQDREAGRSAPPKTGLQLAQEARHVRGSKSGTDHDNDPPRGGGNMAGENGTLQLSEEGQRAIQAAEDKAARLERELQLANDQIKRIGGTVQANEVDSYIKKLSAQPEEGGLGLSEELGFGGVLAEVRQLLLADDGQPALQGDHFAQDGNTTGELTFTDGIKRVFTALSKTQEGKKALGEQLSQPADGTIVEPKEDNASPSGGTTTTDNGKPPAGDPEGEKLSADQKVTEIAKHNPAMAALIGGIPETASTTKITQGGDR